MSDSFRPLVLCYHAVSEAWPDVLSVMPAAFERQLRTLLRRRFRPAPADEVTSGRAGLLHVTFDDAFRSVANALPILERLRVPATVFVCPDFADEGRPLDVPELAEEARKFPAELATMNWDELRELTARGVEVGSHTLSHPHLPLLSDAEIERELVESRERVEANLGRPCRFLAYPYGEHDGRAHAAARRAGYAAAFALSSGDGDRDLYALPRVGIWRKDGLARATLKTTRFGRVLAGAAPRVIPSHSRRRARPRSAPPAD